MVEAGLSYPGRCSPPPPHWGSLPVYLCFKAALEVHPLLLIEPSVGDNLRGHFLS